MYHIKLKRGIATLVDDESDCISAPRVDEVERIVGDKQLPVQWKLENYPQDEESASRLKKILERIAKYVATKYTEDAAEMSDEDILLSDDNNFRTVEIAETFIIKNMMFAYKY